jgi:hypothetical protein
MLFPSSMKDRPDQVIRPLTAFSATIRRVQPFSRGCGAGARGMVLRHWKQLLLVRLLKSEEGFS